MNETDIAYAAGIIDGEGCIGVYFNKVHNNYQLRVQVQMVETEAIDALDKLIDSLRYEVIRGGSRRDVKTWLVLGSKAEEFLNLVLPYLRVKKKQAEVSLTCDWSSYNKSKPLTEEERNIRYVAARKLKELNRRGRQRE